MVHSIEYKALNQNNVVTLIHALIPFCIFSFFFLVERCRSYAQTLTLYTKRVKNDFPRKRRLRTCVHSATVSRTKSFMYRTKNCPRHSTVGTYRLILYVHLHYCAIVCVFSRSIASMYCSNNTNNNNNNMTQPGIIRRIIAK